MPIKYIGRRTDFKGKTLWEILGNLKDFGVGRVVIRNRFQRYPEPCYMRILKVAALPQPMEENENRKVIALVERTFRGKTSIKPIQLDGSTYKTDYILIPKDEEDKYMQPDVESETKILPRTMEFPPLLKKLIIQQKKAAALPVEEDLKLAISYNLSGFKRYRIAEEGEKPTITFSMGLGTPVSPSLYANIKKEST
ncbi:hypothetical protein KPH14_011826 [Odynerus spinipes]|uniref:28S ribosomal protein S34, mitochondrial n=1 Tax=Odynerus spinipes TaxID=1348599 RepID=A0AAD9VTV6_9HYME|nr:hypothetical protein KPH14_011826 [Odynerus spinipes]